MLSYPWTLIARSAPGDCRFSASAVLICRFLLELQHAHQKALDQGSIGTLIGEDDNDPTAGSLQFATAIIGSIGESIDVGPDATSPDIYGDDDGSDEFDGIADERVIGRRARVREGVET